MPSNKNRYPTSPAAQEAKLPPFTKWDLVSLIEDYIFLPRSEIKRFVDIIFYVILMKAKEGYKVSLENFGNFHAYKKGARQARNPALGINIMVPERYRFRFVPTQAAHRFMNPDMLEGTQEKDDWIKRDKKLQELCKPLFEDPYEHLYNND